MATRVRLLWPDGTVVKLMRLGHIPDIGTEILVNGENVLIINVVNMEITGTDTMEIAADVTVERPD